MNVFMPMTLRATRGTVAAATLLMIAEGVGTPAAAAGDFGEHVSTCAQNVGFGADHNPGTHQGRRGWEPDHGC